MGEIEITAADRAAAWPFAPRPIAHDPNPGAYDRWMSGVYDRFAVLRAFAQHRIQARNAALEEAQRDHRNLLAALVEAAGGQIEVGFTTAVIVPQLELLATVNPETGAAVYRTRRLTTTTTKGDE